MEDIRYSGDLHYEISNLGFVSVVRNENFVFPYKNGKPTFTFVFVQRGQMDYFFPETKQTVHLEKDDLLFIPKKLPYRATYLKDNTKVQILTFDFSNQNVADAWKKPIFLSEPEIPLIFNSITSQNRINTLFLAAKIYELLYQTETKLTTIPTKYKKLLPALKELQQTYYKNEKIAYYAKLSNMSEPNFRRLFKEYTGKSPIEYRNLIRILNVKRLMSSGEFKIAEAAYLVGFNNMAFFYETYNKYNTEE